MGLRGCVRGCVRSTERGTEWGNRRSRREENTLVVPVVGGFSVDDLGYAPGVRVYWSSTANGGAASAGPADHGGAVPEEVGGAGETDGADVVFPK